MKSFDFGFGFDSGIDFDFDFDGQLLPVIPTNYQKRNYEEEPEMKKPCILTNLLDDGNIFRTESGDTDGDAKNIIISRTPSNSMCGMLCVRHNLIGMFSDLVNRMLSVKIIETPFREAVESIKAANSWIYVEGVFVDFDGTFKPRMIKMKAECLPKIILQGDTYRLEGDKYIHRFSVGDINYADMLSVVWDDDEEEEVINITHLMGDLTEIPF